MSFFACLSTADRGLSAFFRYLTKCIVAVPLMVIGFMLLVFVGFTTVFFVHTEHLEDINVLFFPPHSRSVGNMTKHQEVWQDAMALPAELLLVPKHALKTQRNP
eukprot:Filipodium_phascolosomae@DN2192_c0_g1_i1.p1